MLFDGLPSTTELMHTVSIPTLSFDRFCGILGPRGASRLRRTVTDAQHILGQRVMWHVNSTATGGGVAEMLQTLLGYERGAGLDARWLVIDGDAPFFALTKRIHNRLHGRLGDDGSLDEVENIERPVRMAVAAQVGKTRLIDNMRLVPEGQAGKAQ